eukprot:TRINITY_DN8736_c2_g2_i1.p1 TRINITY_DN8736_c2_g2~~TRINITY_DN8736_c2_g2_i1.p1  ORF type:complete len:371 (+),score=63.84 TRINITY_DN8736_c2_g2_i1:51-1163(+)
MQCSGAILHHHHHHHHHHHQHHHHQHRNGVHDVGNVKARHINKSTTAHGLRGSDATVGLATKSAGCACNGTGTKPDLKPTTKAAALLDNKETKPSSVHMTDVTKALLSDLKNFKKHEASVSAKVANIESQHTKQKHPQQQHQQNQPPVGVIKDLAAGLLDHNKPSTVQLRAAKQDSVIARKRDVLHSQVHHKHFSNIKQDLDSEMHKLKIERCKVKDGPGCHHLLHKAKELDTSLKANVAPVTTCAVVDSKVSVKGPSRHLDTKQCVQSAGDVGPTNLDTTLSAVPKMIVPNTDLRAVVPGSSRVTVPSHVDVPDYKLQIADLKLENAQLKSQVQNLKFANKDLQHDLDKTCLHTVRGVFDVCTKRGGSL